MNEEDLSKSDLIEIMKRYRKWNAELTVERDAALAVAEKANARWIEMAKVAGEAYRKGVEDAANVVTEHYQSMCQEHRLLLVNRATAILALLEQTEPGEKK